MNDDDWAGGKDPVSMVDFAKSKRFAGSPEEVARGLRLFCCGLARRTAGATSDPAALAAVAVAEARAYGRADEDSLLAAWTDALASHRRNAKNGPTALAVYAACRNPSVGAACAARFASPRDGSGMPASSGVDAAGVLRCVFGNPARATASIRDSSATGERRRPLEGEPGLEAVVRATYASLDFAAWPAIADALSRSGVLACRYCEGEGTIRIGFGGRHGYGPPTACPACRGRSSPRGDLVAHLVAHLREGTPHVLGCWAMESLLGGGIR